MTQLYDRDIGSYHGLKQTLSQRLAPLALAVLLSAPALAESNTLAAMANAAGSNGRMEQAAAQAHAQKAAQSSAASAAESSAAKAAESAAESSGAASAAIANAAGAKGNAFAALASAAGSSGRMEQAAVQAKQAAQAHAQKTASASQDADPNGAADAAERNTFAVMAHAAADQARAAGGFARDLQKEDDPLARRGPSFLARIFGQGQIDATSFADIANDNSGNMWPERLLHVSALTDTTDGSAQLLTQIPFVLEQKMLAPVDQHTRQQAHIIDEMHKGMSFVSYLLHMYTPQASNFHVPFYLVSPEALFAMRAEIGIGEGVLYPEQGADSATALQQMKRANRPVHHLNVVRDLVYQDGPCVGLGYIEADLKGKCRSPHQYNGLVLLSPPIPEVMKEGVFTGEARQVTANVLQSNYFVQGLETGLRLVGINSSFDVERQSFRTPLHSFDQHLFVPERSSFVRPNEKLSEELNAPYGKRDDGSTPLYFVGAQLNALLAPGNAGSHFDLHRTGSLERNTPTAAIAENLLQLKEDFLTQEEEEGASARSEVENFVLDGANSLEEALHAAQQEEEDGEFDAALVEAPKTTQQAGSVLSPQDEEEASASAAATAQALIDQQPLTSEQALYGIPVTFSALGRTLIGLRNTLMSRDQYKNYGFLTEAELAILSDLGYRLEPREFYGASLYSFGTPDKRITRVVRGSYSYYDHASESYRERTPAIIPLGVGLHLYGSYNNVIHSGMVNTKGVSAMGVRVDGSNNLYYQTSQSRIVTSGENGIGIGFTYGANNRAYISGSIAANGPKGIGIKVDMGSNIYSDLIEYRGSYARARSVDYLQGVATKEQAAKVPLTDDLKGPQVTDLVIDGIVEGNLAAIYIDESSLVKNIDITAQAEITGGIYSTWNPLATGSGAIALAHDGKNSQLLDAEVQLERTGKLAGLTAGEIIDRYLTTNINLGVMLDEFNRPLFADGAHFASDDLVDGTEVNYLGNDQSRVVLAGDISGNAINLNHIAGKSTILGNVRANEVNVLAGILSLCGLEGSINQIASLNVNSQAVLDFVNGASSHTYVSGDINFGSEVVVRVDVDAQGKVIDELSYNGRFYAGDYQLAVEPGVSYEEMRRLGADPKAMLNFITNFMQDCNSKFARDRITLRMPRYIWDSAGSYGREIKCTARGCRIGNFSSNAVRSDLTDLPPWRYGLSLGGILLMILGFYAWYYFKPLKNKLLGRKPEQQ